MNENSEINPFISIMHISDIHRNNEAVITNSELNSSLLSDSIKFNSDTPKIKRPDLTIVSGDIIQGLIIGAGNYPSDIENQWEAGVKP